MVSKCYSVTYAQNHVHFPLFTSYLTLILRQISPRLEFRFKDIRVDTKLFHGRLVKKGRIVLGEKQISSRSFSLIHI